ncbi:MAG: prepilin-type N-terminal cleavage/methylation domain-containing protein [Verrucomicrobia bacterium]|nr:prepilin-type N-terminal cleavage/methylation domain-containing protein [Verrucomicrobiota bacterium]MBU4247799.1 prepilin-type N-terminal cleavage/methylation domain-containing protein [Verrucomicrobiota bacterium]MBU4292087.1 prepilin-type N-terminal cleavage/methylation domain-containing protein [Verrucomicrobiota bacterium]MBU4497677.1 prepilin-type N-terminal cleavage/methylation domain-containing protein [Verrucomicrobiota bacterium]MCG2681019.1 prepilin-type N-terminal cleavage/methyl
MKNAHNKALKNGHDGAWPSNIHPFFRWRDALCRVRIPFQKQPKGFTLIELMIASVLFGLAMAGATSVYIMCQKMWHATSLSMTVNRECDLAMSRLVYGIGTNNGLRTASSIKYENKKGMWTGTDHVYPPAPGDPAHFLNPGSPDGSWRITCSNAFDGERWIDFNKEASNIVLWVEEPLSAPHRETRQLICNYVSAAVVATNASGVNIRLTLLRKEGRLTSTNQMSTFVLMRNRKE